MAVRVQMSRQRRWRLDHPAAVIVARPSRWGNPLRWEPGPTTEYDEDGRAVRGRTTPAEARQITVDGFRRVLADPDLRAMYGLPSDEEIRRELAGRDLACWCPLDQPCHADVLLELANEAQDGADETEQHDGEAGEEDERQHEFVHGARRTGTGPGASREPGSAA